MKTRIYKLIQLFIVIPVFFFSSPIFSDNSIDIFDLRLHQSVEEIKKTLIDTFKLRKEQIKEGRFYYPPIDGINVDTLTMTEIKIPLHFNPNTKPTLIKVKKVEVLFTLKLPISTPRSTASKYIVFRFEKNPELQTKIKKYLVGKLGTPSIINTDGYTWRNFGNDKKSCKTSYNLNKPNDICPPNISIGMGETESDIAVAIVDYSMDSNVRKAVKSLKELNFNKSTLPITYSSRDLQVEQVFRNKQKEFEATRDAMYTSELETKSSLNEKINVLLRTYHYKDKRSIQDDLKLKKVIVELENISDESFFSVDVFVIYYDKNNEIIDVVRSIAYSIKPKESFEIESRPSRINDSHATSAYVVYTILNPLKSKEK